MNRIECAEEIKARDAALVAEMAPAMEPHMQAILDAHMARLEREPDDVMGRLIAAHLAQMAAALAQSATAVLLAADVSPNAAVTFVCGVVAEGVGSALCKGNEPLQ